MSPFIENLQNALESPNPRVREAALRTLEELVPRIEDRKLLEEIHELLSSVAKETHGSDKDNIDSMIRMVDSYAVSVA